MKTAHLNCSPSLKISFQNMLDGTCIELQKKSALYALEKIDSLYQKLKTIEDDLALLPQNEFSRD
ncbi:MAG: hypothetical protein Ta2G_04800 [Termitinemataceae bacterium]|nr:MAG: hypothetical protein Ta2G_04800 [Termitinemataceae bacterium]